VQKISTVEEKIFFPQHKPSRSRQKAPAIYWQYFVILGHPEDSTMKWTMKFSAHVYISNKFALDPLQPALK